MCPFDALHWVPVPDEPAADAGGDATAGLVAERDVLAELVARVPAPQPPEPAGTDT